MKNFGVISRWRTVLNHRYSTKINSSLLRQVCKYRVVEARWLSSVTRVGGFTNFEEEKLSRKCVVPEKFNFASDVVDRWAQKEREGVRSTSVPAFWYVSDDGKELKLSFQEVEYESKKLASILAQRCGVKRRDNAIVMLPKIPEYWLITIAAQRVGFVVTPVNTMLTAQDLAYRFNTLKPTSVIAHESVAAVVDEAEKSFPLLKNKILVSEKPNRRPGWHDLNRLEPHTIDDKCALTESDESMMIFFTSGTTGQPKMVEHTHASYGIGSGDYGKYGLDLTSRNILWGMADTGWAFSAYNFFGAWCCGACLFVHQMSRYSAKATLDVLVKYPVDTLASAPLVYKSLLGEDLESTKFKSLEYCLSGGDILSNEVSEEFFARTGIRIFNGLGQSETTGILSMRKCFEYRPGSVGRPTPGLNVVVIDDNENVLGPGATGEIAVERKGAVGMFKGYKDNPEATDAVLTKKYFHSGDLGYYDEEGYYFFVGRKDDVINSSGFDINVCYTSGLDKWRIPCSYRIGPTEVEGALQEHSAVAEVAVVGSPDQERGEVVKAFIILKSSVEPSAELIKELQEHCKRVTAPYKYPRKIEFVKSLPKGPTGKVKRSELRNKEKQNS